MKKTLFRWGVMMPLWSFALVLCMFIGRDRAVKVLKKMTPGFIK